jgi:PKD repeat protein
MKWGARLGAVATVLGALAIAASGASAVVVIQPNGQRVSVALQQGVSAASIPGSIAARNAVQHTGALPSPNGNLDYHGGPVVRSIAPYVIYWTPGGESISPTVSGLINRWFADLATDSGGSSNVFGVDRQFTDAAGFADYKQTFSSSQALVDTQAYPTTGNCTTTNVAYPTCLTDAQVQAEVARFVTANGLPNDGSTSTSELTSSAADYYLVLPTDVNVCLTSTGCANNAFCAWHGSFTSSGSNLLYATIPLLPTVLGSGPGKGCQSDGNTQVQEPNGNGTADIALKYISHEQSETITDPLLNAWWNSNTGNEDGDECNSLGSHADAFTPTLGGSAAAGTLFNQLINGHEYYIQSEWSNGNVDCEMRPSQGTITAGLTPSAGPNPVGAPVTLTPTGSSTNGYSSVTVDYGDGTTSFDHSGSLPASLPHAYSHAGVYTATITAVDPMGNLAQGSSAQFTVGSPPTASFKFSPSSAANGIKVSFDGSGSTDPDSGVALRSFAYNFGDGSTGTGATATHTYSKPGTYNVTLAVVNSIGLMSITSHSVTVVQAKITHAKITHKTRKGAIIVVTVNAPGKLSGVGKSKSVSAPGTYKLKFRLSKAQLHKLAGAGHLIVKLKLKFTPVAGSAFTQKIKLKF